MKRYLYNRWLSAGLAAVVLLALLLVTLPALVSLFGGQMILVNGQSMGGAVPDGSLVIAIQRPAEDLRVGDVIVFEQGRISGDERPRRIVHRLKLIVESQNGRLGYTRGDTNVLADPAPVQLGVETPLVTTVIPLGGILFRNSYLLATTALFGTVALLLRLRGVLGVMSNPVEVRAAATSFGQYDAQCRRS